jgi:hypothetical protein
MDDVKQNIVNFILQSKKQELDSLNHRRMTIGAKWEKIQYQTLEKIKKTCYNQYIWFIKNGIVNENSNSLDLSLKTTTDRDEAKLKIKELDICVLENGINIDNTMSSFNNNKAKANYTKCSKLCLLKFDELFEGCYTDCLTEYTNSMNDIYNITESKLNSIKL